ncbi:MAG: NAD(P)-dependent oxidoreductase [Acidimicrobiia bacterium]|nr:NAD(P)-dependent oxidoreductase [Acidimicrobiia bacterium]
MSDSSTCAFIGLGNMGFPMAGHLLAAGHDVRAYNRTTSVAERWLEHYGSGAVAATPAEAAAGADFVFICVGGDDDVRSVVYGDDGALGALAEGAIIVDHTTASAELARELDEACRAVGVGFIDAPISGGQAGAEAGQLSVMCGGDPDDFAKAEPVIDAYAKAITLVGPAGSGQLTKMVNQILCAGAIQGAAEALAFGEQAGLDMNLVFNAVSQGAAGSWYLSNRAETMLADEFDFGFAVDWMAKDLGLVADEAETIGAPTPLTAMTRKYLADSQAAGDNRLDATVIIRRYREQRDQ